MQDPNLPPWYTDYDVGADEYTPSYTHEVDEDEYMEYNS